MRLKRETSRISTNLNNEVIVTRSEILPSAIGLSILRSDCKNGDKNRNPFEKFSKKETALIFIQRTNSTDISSYVHSLRLFLYSFFSSTYL